MTVHPVTSDPSWPRATSRTDPTRRRGRLGAAVLRRRQRVSAGLFVAGDLVALSASAVVVTRATEGGAALGHLVALLPAWTLLFGAFGLYGGKAHGLTHDTAAELKALLRAVILGSIAIGVAAHTAGAAVQLLGIAAFAALALASLLLMRGAIRHALIEALGPERVALLGADDGLGCLARSLRSRRDLEAVTELALWERADHVVLPATALETHDLQELLGSLSTQSTRVSLLASSGEALALVADGKAPDGAALLAVHARPVSRTAAGLKRASDVALASVALILLAPIMLLLSVAIRIDSAGPALFPQRRVGRRGRNFVMWKLRTMVVEAEQLRQALVGRSRDPAWLHLDHDPRITRFGRLLRRCSLDELPQLCNVLRGEMSLVGPRPLIPVEHELVPTWARVRADVLPGVTGLWQVMGRTALSFEEMVRLDGIYVVTWSLRRDVRILARTAWAVLSGKGAN
jgi:lipopolysaccharide/colanic/teichoic acid biosynthesis glycosyltransferase